jgi:hypothetical protein
VVGADIERDEDAGVVRHVANEHPPRQRVVLDQRRSGQHVVLAGQPRLLVQIDDVQVIAPVEVLG